MSAVACVNSAEYVAVQTCKNRVIPLFFCLYHKVGEKAIINYQLKRIALDILTVSLKNCLS
jgi:hypothetical protein